MSHPHCHLMADCILKFQAKTNLCFFKLLLVWYLVPVMRPTDASVRRQWDYYCYKRWAWVPLVSLFFWLEHVWMKFAKLHLGIQTTDLPMPSYAILWAFWHKNTFLLSLSHPESGILLHMVWWWYMFLEDPVSIQALILTSYMSLEKLLTVLCHEMEK